MVKSYFLFQDYIRHLLRGAGVLCKGHPQLAGRTPGVRSRLCLFGLAPGPQLHGLACAFVLKTDHLVLF